MKRNTLSNKTDNLPDRRLKGTGNFKGRPARYSSKTEKSGAI